MFSLDLDLLMGDPIPLFHVNKKKSSILRGCGICKTCRFSGRKNFYATAQKNVSGSRLSADHLKRFFYANALFSQTENGN